MRPQAELEDTTGVELVQGRSAGCARSMIAVKREKVERAHNFSRVMHELTMLSSFIRLADYLFAEGACFATLALNPSSLHAAGGPWHLLRVPRAASRDVLPSLPLALCSSLHAACAPSHAPARHRA